MHSDIDRRDFQHAVRTYHALPMGIALLLIGVFFALFYLTENVALSLVAAGIPSAFLLWRWVLAAKRVDQWICKYCGEGFPKKMFVIYPPSTCPHCEKTVE